MDKSTNEYACLKGLERDLQQQLTVDPIKVDQFTLVCLVDVVKRYRRLHSALEYLCSRDAVVTVVDGPLSDHSCCTEEEPMLEMAKHLGWEERR